MGRRALNPSASRRQRNVAGYQPATNLYIQDATPPWWEHVPEWVALWLSVPSLHFAVGEPAGWLVVAAGVAGRAVGWFGALVGCVLAVLVVAVPLQTALFAFPALLQS